MKVLHLSTYDNHGGAAKAATNLLNAQLQIGIDATMLCLHKSIQNPQIFTPQSVDISTNIKLASNILRSLRDGKNYPYLISKGNFGAGMVDEINRFNPDIIQLHWVSNFLSIEDISNLKAPLVWYLHDLWPLGGMEHIIHLPENKLLPSDFFSKNSLEKNLSTESFNVWLRKFNAWKKKQFTLISPSHQVNKLAGLASLFAKANTHIIPQPINISKEDFDNQSAFKASLQISEEKKLVLIVFPNGIADSNKGVEFLFELCDLLTPKQRKTYEFIFAGIPSFPALTDKKINFHCLGYVPHERLFKNVYPAMDAVIVPSKFETFSQVTLEAQAIGIPVIAFRQGGPADIITHKLTGWLAKPYNVQSLIDGLNWVTTSVLHQSMLGENGKRIVQEKYTYERIGIMFKEIYNTIP